MLKDQDYIEDKEAQNSAEAGPSIKSRKVRVAEKGEARPARPPAPETKRTAPPDGDRPAADQTDAGAAPSDHDDKPGRGFVRRRPVASAFGALLIVGALGAGYLWWDESSHFQSTDDAFIASRPVALAPKVSGYVTEVPVTDNEHLGKGAVIARIDPRDYRVALEQAEAQVGAAQANIKNIDAQIAVQQAQIAANEAQVDQAQATLVFARQQSARYEQLAQRGAGSVQNAQQFNAQSAQQQAALKTAQAGVEVARRQVESLRAQRLSAQASLAQAQAQADQARLNLSYTTVAAAEPGRVVNLTAEPGEFAATGANLAMFVPDEIWVTANFKENQLDAMRAGQKATFEIDAYPGRTITGHVESIQPGSGTAFSLLPAQNATGNYVKIVQRVPVKIVIDAPPADVTLGPGMSVVPSVRVDASPSLYERLAGAVDRLWSKS
ncbi:membrane fusion protein, multidrug efflux system [Rhodoblastus acidophilus]|uniref:Membrane fusion protein, multidrug efflux system n=1 Tax=Rhodoblastus acidophilus TaxID=1074 RepID=A0A212R8F7_RHOAC|nr:HlyD family secretion protein [Rhodoblastus acidophilus]PPQ37923.1 HlyD family secretion protein [Rhodoblastus acidophilus]RAI24032.1 HlyD family secretion protein [Rhodoblastus acidophilus]SNB68482.1 membrane fusion protein, multidrug efflux system [Rhodoblastus acidophilus]